MTKTILIYSYDMNSLRKITSSRNNIDTVSVPCSLTTRNLTDKQIHEAALREFGLPPDSNVRFVYLKKGEGSTAPYNMIKD